MKGRRVASIGSALVVAGIAALASYAHMRGLALRYGQAEVIADLLPVSVDGMMVVATLALGDGRRYRWSAWLAFWIGVVASVIANVLAAEPSVIARCISAWPAIAFLLVVEVITRGGRTKPAPVPIEVATLPATEPASVADETHAMRAPRKRTPAATQPASKRANDSAAKVARWHAKMPDATHAEIAKKAGVGVRTVARHRPAARLDTTPVNSTPVPELVTTATEA